MVGKDGRRQGGVARGRPLVLVDRTTWAKGVGGGVSFLVGGGFGEGVSVGVWTLGNKCGVIGDGTGSGVTVTEGGCLAGVAKQVPSNLVLGLVARRGRMTWNGEFGSNSRSPQPILSGSSSTLPCQIWLF